MKASPKNVRHHTHKIGGLMRRLVEHLRKDIQRIDEPKAQALFETSAEVLIGLVKAFDDYDKKREAAWRTEPPAIAAKRKTVRAPRRQN